MRCGARLDASCLLPLEAEVGRVALPRGPAAVAGAGLRLMVNLPPGTDELALVVAACEQSLQIFGALAYRARPRWS